MLISTDFSNPSRERPFMNLSPKEAPRLAQVDPLPLPLLPLKKPKRKNPKKRKKRKRKLPHQQLKKKTISWVEDSSIDHINVLFKFDLLLTK